MTTKIMVPLDGSKNSVRGLDQGIKLARSTGGVILGVYVIKIQSTSEKKQGSGEMQIAEKVMQTAKIRCGQNGIDFRQLVIKGKNCGTTIIQSAKKSKVDFVVIGARGRGSVKEVFLGSVSNHILHKSGKIPVMIVR